MYYVDNLSHKIDILVFGPENVTMSVICYFNYIKKILKIVANRMHHGT